MDSIITDTLQVLSTLPYPSEQSSYVLVAERATDNFFLGTIEHLIAWFYVIHALIVADLIAGVSKCVLMHQELRFSRGIRRTLIKMLTYSSVVFLFSGMEVASGGHLDIDVAGCLLICTIEGASIIGNILRPKGYAVDLGALIRAFISKFASVEDDGIIKKINEEDNE